MKQLQTFTYEEAFEACLNIFKGDQLAGTRMGLQNMRVKGFIRQIYMKRTPDDMHWRIAKSIAEVENSYPSPQWRSKRF